jgi:hypothetical protein
MRTRHVTDQRAHRVLNEATCRPFLARPAYRPADHCALNRLAKAMDTESPKEALQEAIRLAGGAAALARRLGIKQPSVFGWEQVPAVRVLAVEAVTGVRRERLRPDLYPQEAAE